MMFEISKEQRSTWLNTIEFDLTTFCNMSCQDCAHGCDKFPSKDYLTVDQVMGFVTTSLIFKKEWRKIGLLGGEPTLNPSLFEIVHELSLYHSRYPNTDIWLMSNGMNVDVLRKVVNDYPWLVVLVNGSHSYHYAFYVSPIDEGLMGTNNRCEALRCGLGFGPYGYTPCVLGTTLHRIFGYDTIDNLTELIYDENHAFEMCMKMFETYCQHCGWYLVDSDCREIGKIWDYDRGYMSKT